MGYWMEQVLFDHSTFPDGASQFESLVPPQPNMSAIPGTMMDRAPLGVGRWQKDCSTKLDRKLSWGFPGYEERPPLPPEYYPNLPPASNYAFWARVRLSKIYTCLSRRYCRLPDHHNKVSITVKWVKWLFLVSRCLWKLCVHNTVV